MLSTLAVVDFDLAGTWPTLVRVRVECSCAYDAYAPDAFVERIMRHRAGSSRPWSSSRCRCAGQGGEGSNVRFRASEPLEFILLTRGVVGPEKFQWYSVLQPLL
jgi:hypothetical protein